MTAAGTSFYFEWEVRLMEWLQMNMGSFAVLFWSLCSDLGEELVMVAIFAFVYWCYDKKMGVYLGTRLMVNLTWNPMIKNIVLRRRPYFDNPGVKILKPVEADADIYDISAQGYSFPSGHSSNASTFYGGIAAFLKKKWMLIVCTVICVLIGVSRFCLGAHYPTDVICGLLLGIVILSVVSFLEKKITNRPLLYLLILLIAVPGWFYCTSTDFYTGFGMTAGFFAGVLFEEKYVNFKESRNIVRVILRLLAGIGLFLGLNEVLKLPFSKEFLERPEFLPFLIRAVRYAIVVFMIVGLFPMVFRIGDRIEAKHGKKK